MSGWNSDLSKQGIEEEILLQDINKENSKDNNNHSNMNQEVQDPDPVESSQEPNISDTERSINDEDYLMFQESQKSKPKRLWHALIYGPRVPQDVPAPRISRLEIIEDLPHKFNTRISKSVRIAVLSGYLILWFLIVYNILNPYFTHPSQLSNNNTEIPVLALSCTDQLWKGKNAACGLNGVSCIDNIDEGTDLIIRCPALCDRSWTYSFEPVGEEQIKYRGYFIGGGDQVENGDKNQLSNPYRADSYICGSAVHAGIVSPFYGGCARMSYSSGSQSGFLSSKGHYGVDDSIEFNSFFPASYIFKTLIGKGDTISHCYDPRFPVLLLNILLGIPIVFLASGKVIFWTVCTVGFWTIVLATDPPVKVDSNDLETYSSLISIGLERFLPSCFILYVLWNCSTKVTLSTFNKDNNPISHLSRLFYFYPMFWLGVLNNISFDRLPVDRFTIHDLKEQPGGLIAVLGIVLFIVCCALIQAYKIWQAGKFKKYLAIYITFIIALVLISNLPGLTLRIHHYILAMLLIPGCCTRGVTALLFQGILLGLFLSGAAKWGLAAIAETETSLRRNDPSGKILPPEILGFDTGSGLLSWADSMNSTTSNVYTGVSLLINDVERFVAENVTAVNLNDLIKNNTQLNDMVESTLKSNFASDQSTIPLYIRIGRKIVGSHKYSDFSKAAILLWPNGDITLPKPGVT